MEGLKRSSVDRKLIWLPALQKNVYYQLGASHFDIIECLLRQVFLIVEE